MKINLTLESGLEVEFTPDFELENESDLPQVKWVFPDPDPRAAHLGQPVAHHADGRGDGRRGDERHARRQPRHLFLP